jgi:tight adherence protein B
VVSAIPYAIGVAVFAIVALLVFALGVDLGSFLKKVGSGFQQRIDRADMQIKPEEFTMLIFGIAVLLWLAAVFLIHTSTLISILILPMTLAFATLAGSMFLKIKGDIRVGKFVTQLELVMRMLAGALRVGLGLRQAIILVTEEVPDPARREFMRVIGRTNIGVPILDALDDLYKSVPSNEMYMFAKVVRVQQSTGGDLSKVLEKLAATIRDRRRIYRKMGGLTAQGRFGGAIIGALPVLIGIFVILTQPDMGHALLYTVPGQIAIGIFVVLEFLACFSINKILTFDV